MFTKMKIGDFAKYNQISVQALRYYESIDLIHPIEIDPFTNYRYYHIKQSAVIDNIQFFQQLDFSLTEIKQIMNDTKTPTELNQVIENKKATLQAELKSIQHQLAEIKVFQEGALIFQEKQFNKAIEFVDFPARWVFTYPTKQNIYQMTEEEYEFSLREFKSDLTDLRKFNCVGSIMARTSFVDQSFLSKEFFIFSDQKTTETRLLPKGTYATYYCHSFQEEIKMLPLFQQELANQGYQIIGDYICEVLYEKNKTSDVNRSMFIRMQVPVSRS